AIFSRMEASAKAHGAELVRAERDLETLFRSRQVTAGSLSLAVEQVAAHRAKVRSAHLLAHLEQTALLSSGQVARYIALRGYTAEHVHGTHQ
ncbi:MAG: hypothetical protein KJZ83_03510, partial [Burkholderiaceae bacterium]|nr:hypothetical protein [Burkholderiaceae bacterium]